MKTGELRIESWGLGARQGDEAGLRRGERLLVGRLSQTRGLLETSGSSFWVAKPRLGCRYITGLTSTCICPRDRIRLSLGGVNLAHCPWKGVAVSLAALAALLGDGTRSDSTRTARG